MATSHRHRYLNNNELDSINPTVSNLQAEILKNTLTTCITIQDILTYYMIYGTVFIINDGQVIDFI